MKNMKTIQIKDDKGSVLFEHNCEGNNVRLTLEVATKFGADLSGADLSGADLSAKTKACAPSFFKARAATLACRDIQQSEQLARAE